MRRWFSLAAFLLALLFIPALAAQTKADTDLHERFVGAWRLVSIETIRTSGEVIYPFYGKHPEGMIMYDSSGTMSVQIVSDPLPAQPTVDSREAFAAAPTKEKAEAAEGYYAYWGTWSLDSANSTVTHHIKHSLMPGEREETVVRHFALEGDRLTLIARAHEMGEDHQRKLIWQKVQTDHR